MKIGHGWLCPRCECINSPSNSKCKCTPAKFRKSICEHIWTVQGETGVIDSPFCFVCGEERDNTE